MQKIQVQNLYLFKAKIACLVLQLAPFIRFVGLTGSLARGQASEKSDIDFFIVTKNGRIWICRAFCLVLMSIFGLKRYKDKIAGRVCLNIFQTDNHLKLSYLDHRESPQWLARDYAHMVPFWSAGQIFNRFVKENNWVEEYDQIFSRTGYRPSIMENILSVLIGLIRFIFEFIYNLFFSVWSEKLLKKYQTRRIKSDIRTINSKKGEIFISDDELRFHPSKE